MVRVLQWIGLWLRTLLALGLGGGAVWAAFLLADAGRVHIAWGPYTANPPVWALAAAAALAALALLVLYAVVFWLASLPAALRRRRARAGHRALTRGLAAVAAGDARAAGRYAERATRKLAGDEARGLATLLSAQAARMNGRGAEASAHFAALLGDKTTEVFGLRGLVQQALAAGDEAQALELAERAATRAPKRGGWAPRLLYDLRVQTRDWDGAYALAPRVLGPAQAASDRRAMDMARAAAAQARGDDPLPHLRRAAKGAPGFVPAAAALTAAHLEAGRRGAAVRVLEAAWRASGGHPELAALWAQAAPRNAKPGRWAARLADKAPDSADSALLLAGAAREAGLWGQARAHLDDAAAREDTARVYAARAELEAQAGAGPDVVADWRARAAGAPPPRAWVCRATGRAYARWAPVAEPHGAFNTLDWAPPPPGAATGAAPLPGPGADPMGALEAPV
jgi:HemY protein